MEPKLQRRRDLMDGYVLAPTGATVGDAVRSADISIPSYRQKLQKKGYVILTEYGANDRAAELRTSPPTLETCRAVVEEIEKRKAAVLAELGDQLQEAEEELAQRDLGRQERSFWRVRAKNLREKIAAIEGEEVTPEELHMAFVREDVTLRATAVPPQLREALEAIERERALLGSSA